jgi:hypothetical protein
LLNAVLIVALCPLPVDTATVAADPAVLVRLNVVGVAGLQEADTVYVPALLLAVKVDAVATPVAIVAAVVVTVLLANRPLAPVDGAVNVTVAPWMATPPASFTVAARAVPKAVLMVADCPDVLATTVMLAATCTTVKVSKVDAPLLELVWVRSPPP